MVPVTRTLYVYFLKEDIMSRIAKLIVIVIVLAMVGCSYENSATVSIDTGIRKQAQLSLLDKVIAWFSLSKAVQADQPPGDVIFEELTLTVSASDMSTITQTYSYVDIINNHGKITLEIPAGSQRAFEIVASRREMTGSLIPRYYGGIKTVDLSPGQNVNLDIEMGKLAIVSPYWNSYNNNIEIQFMKSYSQPLFFKVYENIGVGAPIYKLIDTVDANKLQYEEDSEMILYYYSNPAISSGNFGQFYISAVNQYGEGEKTYIME